MIFTTLSTLYPPQPIGVEKSTPSPKVPRREASVVGASPTSTKRVSRSGVSHMTFLGIDGGGSW